MACRIKYKGVEYSEEDFKVIASVHQTIKEDLKNTKAFRTEGDNLFESKFDNSKLNAGRTKIGEINKQFGATVVSAQSSNRQVNINVNPVADTILEVQKKSTNPKVIQGQFLFQKLQENTDKNKPDVLINNALKSFLSKNNISVKYLESIEKITGEDSVAAYDTVNKTILVAQGKEDLNTLPEETGHSIIETLGTNHPLVKALLHHVSQMDYSAICGPDYVKDYGSNKDLLVREAAAKLIGKAIVGKSDGPILGRAFELIQKILHSFFNLFTHTSDFQDHMKEALNKASQISEKVFAGEVFDDRYSNFQSQPTNQFFFQKDPNKRYTDTAKDKFEKKKAYLNRLILNTKRKIAKEQDPVKKQELNETLSEYSTKFADYQNNPSQGNLASLGEPIFEKVRTFISDVQTGKIDPKDVSLNDIAFCKEAIDQFKQSNLAQDAIKLEDDLQNIRDTALLNFVDKNYTKKGITPEMLDEITPDIAYLRGALGALVDTSDILGSSLGSAIKSAQSRISRFTEKESEEINKADDELRKYQTSKGLSGDDIYKVFIQKDANTTTLTRQYNSQFYADRKQAIIKAKNDELRKESAKWFSENYDDDGNIIPQDKYVNKDYQTIQKSPELKKFYDFYKSKIAEAFLKLPVNNGENFIPNISDKTLYDVLQSEGLKGFMKNAIGQLIKGKTIQDKSTNSDLQADEISLKYLSPMKAENKSNNLSAGLLVFSLFANSHNEMSELLPVARIVQAKIGEKTYQKYAGGRDISGTNSNIYQMTADFIKMQIKGDKKVDFGKISYTGYDENGKQVEKQFAVSTLFDIGMKYNSILRIGFNPFLAVSNVVVGDLNNLIESVGGKFFTSKDLGKASGIFYSQVYNKDSKLMNILKVVNPLRELEDREAIDKTRLKDKKWNWDKFLSWAYKPQSRGELFLQSRLMTASMLHDKITDKNGKEHSLWEAFDDKGEWKKDLFGELNEDRTGKMVNRIQRIIEMTHGRYSAQDASRLNQYVGFRLINQFRKWIPAAAEARFGGMNWDNRLGEYIEGRWKATGRLAVEGLKRALGKNYEGKRAFMDMQTSLLYETERIKKGGLTELDIANLKKTAVEAIIILATIVVGSTLLSSGFKKKHHDIMTDPVVKFALDQLNRVSGDIEFFASPNQIFSMPQNAIPLAKTMTDIATCAMNIQYIFGGVDANYSKGSMKGENRFWQKFSGLVPGLNPIMKIKRNWNKTPFNQTFIQTR